MPETKPVVRALKWAGTVVAIIATAADLTADLPVALPQWLKRAEAIPEVYYHLVILGSGLLALWLWRREWLEKGRQLHGDLGKAEEGKRRLQGQLVDLQSQLDTAREENRQLRQGEHDLRANLEDAENSLEQEQYRSAEFSRVSRLMEENREREDSLRGAATATVATYLRMVMSDTDAAREECLQQVCGLRSVIYEYLSEEQRGRDHPLARTCGEIAGACADKETAPNKLEGPIRTLANLFGLDAFMPPSPP